MPRDRDAAGVVAGGTGEGAGESVRSDREAARGSVHLCPVGHTIDVNTVIIHNDSSVWNLQLRLDREAGWAGALHVYIEDLAERPEEVPAQPEA